MTRWKSYTKGTALPMPSKLIIALVLLCLPFLSTAGIQVISKENLADTVMNYLIDADWDPRAAKAVSHLNAETFFIMQEEYPEGFQRTLDWLALMNKDGPLMLALREHPELAGLLARSPNPKKIISTLDARPSCYDAMLGFYGLFPDRDEQMKLAALLHRHAESICALAEHGVPMSFMPFWFDHDSDTGRLYASWLDEALGIAMQSRNRDERLAQVIAFAQNQGKFIRDRMQNNLQFARRFKDELWPAFWRITDCQDENCIAPFEVLADEPGTWQLLMQPEGEVLISNWGLLAIAWLTRTDVIPQSLHGVARDALMLDQTQILNSLVWFAGNHDFQRLMLRKDISENLRLRLLADLSARCPGANQGCKWIKIYATLPPATLEEELAPLPSGPRTWIPFYSTYYLGKKMVQGRPLDTSDSVFAAMDMLVFIPLMKGGKMVAQTLKRVPKKTVAKASAETVGRRLPGKMNRSQVQVIETLMKNSPTANTKTYLKPWVRRTRNMASGIDDLTRVDATKFVQWSFRKSGIGRESFKHLTGLEARIFMRRDGRVIIDPKKGAFSAFIEDAALNALGDLSVEAADNAWQQYVSRWWLTQVAIP